MSFSLKNLLGSTVEKVVGSIGKALDDNITNKEERMAAEKAVSEVLLNYQVDLDKEVTERLKIDMASDSELAKIVRPLSLIFTTLVITVLALTDGNIGGFTVGEEYILLFKSLLILQYGFYFGSRAAEKIVTTINKK
jgi:hypothetical protein